MQSVFRKDCCHHTTTANLFLVGKVVSHPELKTAADISKKNNKLKKNDNNNNQESHDEHLIDYDGDEDDNSPLWHSLSCPGKCGAPWFLCTAPDTLPGSDWRHQTGQEDEPCTATGQRVKQGDTGSFTS